MSDLPRLQDDAYQLIKEIGGGAVATVWRAVHVADQEVVAVKVMRDESMDMEDIQRMAQEVDILKHLRHPCIVRFHDTGVTLGGNPYVVMEWVEGVTLREMLDEQPQLLVSDVRDIINQIGSALAEAHEHEVVHRDVKPENVMLCAPEFVAAKLLDFGMAKVLSPDAASLTINNQIFGTPQYMAPERVVGSPVTAAADVYAVAVMAYEMLKGRRPFDGNNPVRIMTAQLRSPPPPIGGVSPEVERVIQWGLAKVPEDRPSARDFAHALDLALATD